MPPDNSHLVAPREPLSRQILMRVLIFVTLFSGYQLILFLTNGGGSIQYLGQIIFIFAVISVIAKRQILAGITIFSLVATVASYALGHFFFYLGFLAMYVYYYALVVCVSAAVGYLLQLAPLRSARSQTIAVCGMCILAAGFSYINLFDYSIHGEGDNKISVLTETDLKGIAVSARQRSPSMFLPTRKAYEVAEFVGNDPEVARSIQDMCGDRYVSPEKEEMCISYSSSNIQQIVFVEHTDEFERYVESSDDPQVCSLYDEENRKDQCITDFAVKMGEQICKLLPAEKVNGYSEQERCTLVVRDSKGTGRRDSLSPITKIAPSTDILKHQSCQIVYEAYSCGIDKDGLEQRDGYYKMLAKVFIDQAGDVTRVVQACDVAAKDLEKGVDDDLWASVRETHPNSVYEWTRMRLRRIGCLK